MSRRSSASIAVAALLLSGVAPPLAAAQDLRSPDARDVAAQTATAGGTRAPAALDAAPPAVTFEDLRSPDARDAAAPSPTPADLRSPDARDVGRPRTVVPVRIVTVADGGFDWRDAAIGAGGAFGVALLLGGGVSLAGRRRAERRVAA